MSFSFFWGKGRGACGLGHCGLGTCMCICFDELMRQRDILRCEKIVSWEVLTDFLEKKCIITHVVIASFTSFTLLNRLFSWPR